MMETSIGIAAGLALAAALPDLPYACGLATAGLLGGDVVREPLRPRGRRAARCERSAPDLVTGRHATRAQDQSRWSTEPARGGTRGRRPRCIDTERPGASRRAMRTRDVDVLGRRATRRPAATGISSSSSRSQFDRLRALPEHAELMGETLRPCCARGDRRTRRAPRGSDANIGCASHRSRNASTPSRSTLVRERLVGSRVGRRARSVVGDAGRRARRARVASTRSGRSSASCRQSRPPIEYPTYVAGPPASPSACGRRDEVEVVGNLAARPRRSTDRRSPADRSRLPRRVRSA